MPSCCGRWFSDNGYRNHLDNSIAHATYDYECDICDCCFRTQNSLDDHMEDEPGHQNYCYSCKRSFTSVNALNQHLKSSIHVGKNVKCPWCPNKYTNLTGVTLHLESGSCSSGINRQKIDQYCRQVDRNHLFTTKLIGYHDNAEQPTTIATRAAWDGDYYRCYFCTRGFSSLISLNQHLASPAHQQKTYHCPRCKNQYVTLSALVNHLESESCGAWRFGANMAGNLDGVVGRLMITG